MTTSNKNKLPPIVLIHGAWHGAWCWDDWVQELRQSGYPEVVAVELRGHGYKEGSFKRASLDNYVEDVRLIIDNLEQTPILIGHSLGCTIIERLCVQQRFLAVVLLAPIPDTRSFRRVFLRQVLQHPIIAFRSLVSRSMQPWVTSRSSPRLFFGSKMPLTRARAYVSRMQGESFRLFIVDLLRLRQPMNTLARKLIVAAEQDKFFPLGVQKALANRLGATFMVAKDSGHDIMLDVSGRLTVRVVIDWLNDPRADRASQS